MSTQLQDMEAPAFDIEYNLNFIDDEDEDSSSLSASKPQSGSFSSSEIKEREVFDSSMVMID